MLRLSQKDQNTSNEKCNSTTVYTSSHDKNSSPRRKYRPTKNLSLAYKTVFEIQNPNEVAQSIWRGSFQISHYEK